MPATRAPKTDVRIRVAPSKLMLDAIVAAGVAVVFASEMAEILGWPIERARAEIGHLDRRGRVETWDAPEKAGDVRVMLSAREARIRRLVLAEKGDRWIRPQGASGGRSGDARDGGTIATM